MFMYSCLTSQVTLILREEGREKKHCMYNQTQYIAAEETRCSIQGWLGSSLPPLLLKPHSDPWGAHQGPGELGRFISFWAMSPVTRAPPLAHCPAELWLFQPPHPLLSCSPRNNSANWFGTGLTSNSFIWIFLSSPTDSIPNSISSFLFFN